MVSMFQQGATGVAICSIFLRLLNVRVGVKAGRRVNQQQFEQEQHGRAAELPDRNC
jgi:hypothetical protein